MKKYALFFPLIILLFSSCKERIFKKKSVYQGQVVIKGSRQPLYQAKVALLSYKSGFLTPRYDFRTEEVVFSDENGNYKIIFDNARIEKERYYYLSAFKKDAHVYPVNIHDLDIRKDLNRLIEVPAEGWARVNFRNVSGEKIEVIHFQGLQGLTIEEKNIWYPSKETTIIGSYKSAFSTSIRTVLKFSGNLKPQKVIDRNIILSPLDTIEVNIQY